MRGWRRIGIVLSVFWFIGFGWWLRQDTYDSAWKISGYDRCGAIADMKRAPLWNNDDLARVNREEHECEEKAKARFLRDVTPLWGVIVADALSLGALWLLAWIVVAVGRWVAAGFRQQA
jgi:hypothetical protein